ncbi:MAG: hypothetical protein IM584_01860 [Chitinophagaceae bacterium]|nr:hypothetical protein [Chitinophagaceae bacterium]MCA6454858.1 hypothetical protein [Chitinophagaceae bacterium]MCA6465375.1 hypothetical protein [Chitinophagaceae bacterium]
MNLIVPLQVKDADALPLPEFDNVILPSTLMLLPALKVTKDTTLEPLPVTNSEPVTKIVLPDPVPEAVNNVTGVVPSIVKV